VCDIKSLATNLVWFPGGGWVRDLTQEGIEPNPGPACHKCGKHGHDGKQCKLPPAVAAKTKKEKQNKNKNKNNGGKGKNSSSAAKALAASVSDGLAAQAGANDALKEKAKEAREENKVGGTEPPPIEYGKLPTNGRLTINHKVFDHPDFVPDPRIFKVTTSVAQMFMPELKKNWESHCAVGFGVASATLIGCALSGRHFGPIGSLEGSVCLGSLAIVGSVLSNVWELMSNLVVRTYYTTKRVISQANIDLLVGKDTEIRPERMHHADKIKYADPSMIEMEISDVVLDRRDDSVYVSIPRKRGLNVSLELFSQFAGYTMLNAPTREFYLGLQRDIKRMCSIRFERYNMSMGTIMNDTSLFITAYKLSEMTKRDMHETPLN
jgi:hypothetical protein